MMALFWLLPAFAQDAPWEERLPGEAVEVTPPTSSVERSRFGLQGASIETIGGSTGVSAAVASVLGTDGGTTAYTATTDLVWDLSLIHI